MLTAADTQWRVSGLGGPYGLDYGAIAQIAHGFGIHTDRLFYRKVRVYEREALRSMNDKDACTEAQKAQCKLEFPTHLEWACKQCREMKEKRHGI